MPVYTFDQAITLNLSHGDPAELIVSYTFQPDPECPRVLSPATTEPPELYPLEIRTNLKAVKDWMKRAEVLNEYHPKPLKESWYILELQLDADGKLTMEYTVGVRDESDPPVLATDPPPLVYKRVWDPSDDLITTDARGEFDISYPAFQQFIQGQEDFLQIIGQIKAGNG